VNARILPRSEWSKLAVSGIAPMEQTLRPEDVQMVVIEDEGRIVATMGVFRVTHFEGLWIDPEYRGNAGLGRRLIKMAITAARKWAGNWVWGASETSHMDDVLSRLGGACVPVKTYIIPIGGN
jgi:ribosomal protein S18 acetylase RimI-like enzyme